jgi:hypothetical protein
MTFDQESEDPQGPLDTEPQEDLGIAQDETFEDQSEDQVLPDVTLDDLDPRSRAIVEKRLKDAERGITQKFQDLAEQRKKAEAVLQENEQLRALMQDPDFLETLQKKARGQKAAPRIQHPYQDVELTEDWEAARGEISKLSIEAVSQAFGDRIGQIEAALMKLLQGSQQTEWQSFASKHPEAVEYESEISAFRKRNPNATYEEALKATAGDKIAEARLRKKTADARRVQGVRHGSRSGRAVGKQGTDPMELLRQAKIKLGYYDE